MMRIASLEKGPSHDRSKLEVPVILDDWPKRIRHIFPQQSFGLYEVVPIQRISVVEIYKRTHWEEMKHDGNQYRVYEYVRSELQVVTE